MTAPEPITAHRLRLQRIVQIATRARDRAAWSERAALGEIIDLAEEELSSLGGPNPAGRLAMAHQEPHL